MILFIYVCILVLNLVAVFLIYRFLGEETGKKEKWISIAIGIAIMYLLVTLVYWLSTKNINLGSAGSTAQNLITFAFVPVNGIIILPYLARSYNYYKLGKIKFTTFQTRVILLVCALVLILIIEFFYFKDIQNGILSLINSRS